MLRKIIKCKFKEKHIDNIRFKINKFNSKPFPKNKKEIIIICCFSEFGCETLGCMYCIPQITKEFSYKYKIAVGWHGREYLYRHLVDEFWEIEKDYMWLKEYSRAFHNVSKNLLRIEDKLNDFGIVFPSAYLGTIAVCSRCNICRSFFIGSKCNECSCSNFQFSLFENINFWKSKAIKIPDPCKEKINYVKKYIKKPCVGIFARGRKCYGRNLQPEFYIKLIKLLEDMGYNPIWLGEKESVQPCPVKHIIDFADSKESSDLELTLAIIKQCEFTIQFWTASTRLSGIMGIPYILFESPDQIYGRGQEGFRRNLCDFGPSKLSINHYLNIYDNNKKGLEIVKKCIEELLDKNYNDIIGEVENKWIVEEMQKIYRRKNCLAL